MRGIRAVFLDAGGTLFRERPSRAAIYARAARRRGLPIRAAEMRRVMGEVHLDLARVVRGHFRYTDGWFEEYIRRVFRGLGVRGDLAAVRRELFEAFSRPETFTFYPETPRTLRSLRRAGYRLGIISNWSPRLSTVVRGLGLDRVVRFALASATERLEKPDPRIFLRACRLAGVRPEEAVHVGDSVEKDVLGARAAGIHAVHLERSRNGAAPIAREGEVVVIRSLDRLPALLRRGAIG